MANNTSASIYSCHSDRAGPEPRGRPTELLVQDGWRVMRRGDCIVREAVMVKLRSEWLPMKCGALKQEGYTDENCCGCTNNQEAA